MSEHEREVRDTLRLLGSYANEPRWAEEADEALTAALHSARVSGARAALEAAHDALMREGWEKASDVAVYAGVRRALDVVRALSPADVLRTEEG